MNVDKHNFIVVTMSLIAGPTLEELAKPSITNFLRIRKTASFTKNLVQENS